VDAVVRKLRTGLCARVVYGNIIMPERSETFSRYRTDAYTGLHTRCVMRRRDSQVPPRVDNASRLVADVFMLVVWSLLSKPAAFHRSTRAPSLANDLYLRCNCFGAFSWSQRRDVSSAPRSSSWLACRSRRALTPHSRSLPSRACWFGYSPNRLPILHKADPSDACHYLAPRHVSILHLQLIRFGC
jgi:hypothetical protein